MSSITLPLNEALEAKAVAPLPIANDPFRGLPVTPVERRSGLNRTEISEYLTWPGRPFILTDAASTWPAMQTWSFSNLARDHGTLPIVASPNLTTYQEACRLPLEKFLVYCQSPQLSPLSAKKTATSYYLARPLIELFPEYIDDWKLPSYIENIYSPLTGDLRDWYERFFVWIFIGPSNTVTKVHVDQYMTHTITTQIRGTKKFQLFSPLAVSKVPGLEFCGPRDTFKLPSCEGLEEEPVIHEAIVHEGESVVLPAGWAHQVVSLTPSITLSVNFVDSFNSLAHLMTISRHVPAWIQKINVPAFRRGNGCTWSHSDFEKLGN